VAVVGEPPSNIHSVDIPLIACLLSGSLGRSRALAGTIFGPTRYGPIVAAESKDLYRILVGVVYISLDY
jgi:hypothetical protein